MNDKDFEIYQKIVLSLLSSLDLADGKTGYGSELVFNRLVEYSDAAFKLLIQRRDQEIDEEEL